MHEKRHSPPKVIVSGGFNKNKLGKGGNKTSILRLSLPEMHSTVLVENKSNSRLMGQPSCKSKETYIQKTMKKTDSKKRFDPFATTTSLELDLSPANLADCIQSGPSSKVFDGSQNDVSSKMERQLTLPVLKKKQTNLRSLVNSSEIFLKSGQN